MKILSTLAMIVVLSVSVNATPVDKMAKKQCRNIINSNGTMMDNTYVLGIVEGINYTVPYSDATELAKSGDTKNVVLIACKNAFENKTVHGFDADYKWQAMKLTSKKHSEMEQQF